MIKLPRKEFTFMANHKNPLEKELLIKMYKNSTYKLSEFCTLNNVSDSAFKKWLTQYEQDGLEGLARADKDLKDVLPIGIDKTEEAYKREILKLRIELERTKKNYTVLNKEDGTQVYVRLKTKNSK